MWKKLILIITLFCVYSCIGNSIDKKRNSLRMGNINVNLPPGQPKTANIKNLLNEAEKLSKKYEKTLQELNQKGILDTSYGQAILKKLRTDMEKDFQNFNRILKKDGISKRTYSPDRPFLESIHEFMNEVMNFLHKISSFLGGRKSTTSTSLPITTTELSTTTLPE